MSSPYTDEKNPDVVYQVIPVLEAVEVKPRRPLWRRFIRIILTFVGISMIYSAIAPAVHHSCHHGRKASHHFNHQDGLQMPTVNKEVSPSGKPHQHFTFDSALDHFWFKQESFSAVPTRTEVVGTIYVASCSKAKNISAHFSVDATDDDIRDAVEITAHQDGIRIRADPFSLVKQRVNVTGYIVIPNHDDYKLLKLYVKTVELPVQLTESFKTRVNATYVETVSGDVHSAGTDGNLIDVNNLKIKTVSGGIFGDFAVQHALALESTSGNIEPKLYSEKLPEQRAWLKTETTSGKTKAFFVGGLHPRPLYSKHKSTSGSITISYPTDWQGGLKVESTTGKLSVVGEGTKIIKKEKDVTKRLWEVIKGDGKSKGYVGSVSGNIDVRIGQAEK